MPSLYRYRIKKVAIIEPSLTTGGWEPYLQTFALLPSYCYTELQNLNKCGHKKSVILIILKNNLLLLVPPLPVIMTM